MASRIPALLSDYLKDVTKASALDTVITAFRSRGFKNTNWTPGSIGTTVIHFLADCVAQQSGVNVNAVRSGFLSLAEGRWLTLLASDQFETDRYLAEKTKGWVRLTSSAGAAPYTIAPYSKWIQNASGLRYVNTTGDTLASGDGQFVDLVFEAENPGASYNLPAGTALSLVTSMPGVTASMGSSWITKVGLDEESDDSLRARCKGKLATISFGQPELAYEYYARQASSAVTRVRVDTNNPFGAGSVAVYLASNTGPVTNDVLTEVNTHIQVRRAPGSRLFVYNSSLSTIPLTGTIFCQGISTGIAQSRVEEALLNYFNGLPIGGINLFGEATGKIYKDALLAAILKTSGVAMATITDPSVDITYGNNREVAFPTFAGLTYTAV